MNHLLLDSNTYGKIAIDPERAALIEQITKSHLVVHNFALIREELRNTSRSKTAHGTRRLRTILLAAYDQLTTNRVITVSPQITRMASEFYNEYKRLGGGVSKKRIHNDFKIVACATLIGCDVVVSDDHHSMRATKALRAYGRVAFAHHKRAPSFLAYRDLKASLAQPP